MKKLKKKEPTPSIIAIAWYWPEQWQELLHVSEDRDKIENTFEEWQELAEKRCIQLLNHGYAPYKIDVDINKLVEWCKNKGMKIDGEARALYAAAQMQILFNKYH